nr:RES family NAD+ phosphorylase [Mycobacterium avium]
MAGGALLLVVLPGGAGLVSGCSTVIGGRPVASPGAGPTEPSFPRPLRVLALAADSRGARATRVGGTFAISTARHTVTQQWARHITAAFPHLDGLRYNSRFAGDPCLALFPPAASEMPARPRLSLPLAHPDLAGRVAGAAKRLGYGVV